MGLVYATPLWIHIRTPSSSRHTPEVLYVLCARKRPPSLACGPHCMTWSLYSPRHLRNFHEIVRSRSNSPRRNSNSSHKQRLPANCFKRQLTHVKFTVLYLLCKKLMSCLPQNNLPRNQVLILGSTELATTWKTPGPPSFFAPTHPSLDTISHRHK